MASAERRVTVRPINVGALLEAAEASGLDDDQIGALILKWFPESLDADIERCIRRAVEIPTDVPTARLLEAIKDVDDEPDDEPAWPAPLIEGDQVPLPGMDEVAERSAERRYPS